MAADKKELAVTAKTFDLQAAEASLLKFRVTMKIIRTW